MKTQEQIATLKGMHSDSVTCMAMDGYFLFTGSDDRTIVMWNLQNFTHIGVLNEHKTSVQDLMMLKAGFLCSCSYDRKVLVWDYYKGEVVKTYTRKKTEFRCIAAVESKGKLLAGTNEKQIITFDI